MFYVYLVLVCALTVPGPVAFVGDSWVSQGRISTPLATELATTVLNYGQTGASASTFDASHPVWQKLADADPAIVIWLVGTNDESGGAPPELFELRMMGLVTRTRLEAPHAWIILLAPADNGLVTRYPMDDYRSALRAVAATSGAAYLDAKDAIGPYAPGPLYQNPTHLSAEGGRRVAELLADHIQSHYAVSSPK
jgi:lysophospholipase L1-like esterase